ncbi:MAG: sigma-54 interaction domain-containing protein [Anaerovoracaceae bacterium]
MIKKLFKDHYDELLEIANCINVGIYVTDGEGVTILANDESCRTGGLTREDVMGKTMESLEKEGFIKESVTLKTLRSGKPENMIQDLGDGGKVFVSSQPLKIKDEIAFIITTERDITETQLLKEVLKERDEIAEKYLDEINYLKSKHIGMDDEVVAVDIKSQNIVKQAIRVAKHDTTVLLTGESGTGKEVYANLIYRNSQRVGKPFIKLNCAAIPENLLEAEMFGYEKGAFTGADEMGKIGYFELANGGTLFLDEIGDLPIHLQSKLLRVLQEKEIIKVGGTKPIPLDIRLITATNMDLSQATKNGDFREDLFYRLNVMPIEILPLRKRRDDIEALAVYFTEKYSKAYKLKKRISQDALEALQQYDWPGNVRELQNILERCVLSFDGPEINRFQIQLTLYPNEGGDGLFAQEGGKTLHEMVEEYEKKILMAALDEYKLPSNVAKHLGVDKSTISRKMQKYQL